MKDIFTISLLFSTIRLATPLVLAAMGVALYGVFAAIERRITAWAYAE